MSIHRGAATPARRRRPWWSWPKERRTDEGDVVNVQDYLTCPTCGRLNEPRTELMKTQKTVDEKQRAYDEATAAWRAASTAHYTAQNNTRQVRRGIGGVDKFGRRLKEADPAEIDQLAEESAAADRAMRAARAELDEAIRVRDAAAEAAAEAKEAHRAEVEAAIAEAQRAHAAAVDAAVHRATVHPAGAAP